MSHTDRRAKTCITLDSSWAKHSASRQRWWLLPVVAACLGIAPVHGQQVFWTDGFSSVKKLGPGGTVETVVADSEQTKGLAINQQTGQLYWASAEIERANLDGSNRELVVFTGLANALGIDIDSTNGKIYWADNQTNAVSRANLDGSGIEAVIPEFSVLDVAVDPIGGKVYWNANSMSLKRANLDGTNVETLVNIPGIGDIDIDLVGRKIYWDHFLSGTHFIRRANLDGTLLQPVVSGGNHTGTFSIGLDQTARKIYWGCVVAATPQGPACQMWRANLDGSAPEVVVTTGSQDSDFFFDIRIIPAPGELCGLSLSLANGTLDLDFQMATSAPATWNLWLSTQSASIRLFAIPLPVLTPARPISFSIPGLPPSGNVGFLTTLTTPSKGIVCSDWETVDTGLGAADTDLIRRLQERLGVASPPR